MSDANPPIDADGSSDTAAQEDGRVWVADSEGKYYLSTVSEGSLHLLEDVKKKVSRAAIEALQAGSSAAEAFGEKCIVIPADSIEKILIAEHDDCIKIWHGPAGSTKKQTVLMESFQEQEELTSGLSALLPNAKRTEQSVSIVQAILGPGLLTLTILAGTVVCYLAAADIDPNEDYNPTGRRRGMKVMVRNLFIAVGPNGVAAIGVLAFLGSCFWVYRRITNPPTQVIIERGSD